MASRSPAAGGGPVAAITLCLAAALVEMTARYSVDRAEAAESVAAEAAQIRARAAGLAEADTEAYERVLAVRAQAPEQLPDALTRAAEVPLEVAELGAKAARLARRLVAEGKPDVRGDAATGMLLAESATRSSAHLVAVNVEAGATDAGLLVRAQQAVRVAADAVAGFD